MNEKRYYKFFRGTSQAFSQITPNSDTVYFIQDTRELYLGDRRFGIGTDVNVNVVGVGDCVRDITYDPTAKLFTITKGDAGSLDSVQAAIQAALPDITVTGVIAGDKILSLNGTELATTLSISTQTDPNTDKVYVVLKGIGGVEISKFDASQFVASGFLQSVTIEERIISGQVHKVLVFTFVLADGTTQIVECDLQELIDVYTAMIGGGLGLDGNAFYIDNDVIASSGLNTDVTGHFGEAVTLNTIKYSNKGLITDTCTYTFTLPGLSGSVGTAGQVAKLVSYVSLSDSGELVGQAADVSTSLSDSSTDLQIPTAKAVWQAVKDHAGSTWEVIT